MQLRELGVGVATDISLVFRLTLLEPIERGIIVLATASIMASTIVAAIIHLGNKDQLELQKKVESARLIRDLHTSFMNESGFQDFREKIFDPVETTYYIPRLDAFLYRFDYIATFWHEGLLTNFHVNAVFGTTLEKIRSDSFIQKRIKERKENSLREFPYLRELLERSKEWNSS